MTNLGRCGKRIGGVVVIALALSAQSCGGDASGCDDFDPGGPSLAVGESTEIEVRIENGGWGEVEADGMYWAPTEPVPDGVPRDGILHGRATRPSEYELVVDYGEFGPVTYTGPVTCE